MLTSRLLALSAVIAFSPLSAQSRLTSAIPGTPVREVSAVFISMADCCSDLTPSLRGPIDTLRTVMKRRARQADEAFRLIGVSLDWSPKVGWDYLSQFGEFDEMGLGSNWFGLQPEILMWSGVGVPAIVPQLVIFERQVTVGGAAPTFGPRKVLRVLRGRDEIVAWIRDGARLP